MVTDRQKGLGHQASQGHDLRASYRKRDPAAGQRAHSQVGQRPIPPRSHPQPLLPRAPSSLKGMRGKVGGRSTLPVLCHLAKPAHGPHPLLDKGGHLASPPLPPDPAGRSFPTSPPSSRPPQERPRGKGVLRRQELQQLRKDPHLPALPIPGVPGPSLGPRERPTGSKGKPQTAKATLFQKSEWNPTFPLK